jgi:hypothetical protein
MRRRQRGCEKTQKSRNRDPATNTTHQPKKNAFIHAKPETHSKIFEYNSFRTLNNCIPTNIPPSGMHITESMKLPSKPTLHIDAEHIPPMSTSCHQLYNGGLRISVSSSVDASETDNSSWITFV